MFKLEYLSQILHKSCKQIYAICVNLNTNQSIRGWTIAFCFVFQKKLRDRRSHWSRQISTLWSPILGKPSATKGAVFIPSPSLTLVRSVPSNPTCSSAKGSLPLPKRMNFRKSSEGGGGHFQSKNLYCKIWTFEQGFFGIKMIHRGIFRVCYQ